MEREVVINLLARFFVDEFENDANFVNEWLQDENVDADVFIKTVEEMVNGSVPNPA